MKIAVLSDIHDHKLNLERCLQDINQIRCDAILALGDYCTPETVSQLITINLPIFGVFGNNDADQKGIIKAANDKIDLTSPTIEYKELELDHKKIAITHYPTIARLLAKTKKYDAIFWGHSHFPLIENEEHVLLCNPGAVCGRGRGQHINPTFVLYDSQKNTAQIFELQY